MKENRFTVRLSFDGNKETHDLNRVAKDGVSCYEKIFENIMKVKDSGLNFSVRMTVTENTIPYMFENICYLHEHGLDNICMIMDVYLKISDELKAEFEKQVGQILQYYLAEAAAGRVFTIDQFDGKMLICCVTLETALACAMLELEISRSFRTVRYTHADFLQVMKNIV